MSSLGDKLGTEKIRTLLYKLSLPAIIGLVVNSLYNVVDTIFIGQGVGPMAIGGLAIAFPVQMLSIGLANLVGIGAASAVSRNLGAKNTEKAHAVAGNAYFLILAISLVFTAVGLLFTDSMLKVFGATESLIPYARDYVRIILLGNVFFSLKMTAQLIIQAEGNAKPAMTSTVLGGLLNIALDPIFIFGFNMGIKGAAIATVIAQIVSFLYLAIYLLRGKSLIKPRLAHMVPRLDIITSIFSVGSSAFARTATNTIFLIVINNSLRIYGGDVAISTFGIVNRIVAFLFLPVLGIVQGMQPIAGYNHGARQPGRVKEVLNLSIVVSTLVGALGLVIGLLAPHIIIRAFTSDQAMITNGSQVLRIVIAVAPFMGIQFVGSTLFQAIGKSGPAIVLSLLRQFVLLTPLVLILPRVNNLGLMGVWLAFPIADMLAVLITMAVIRREVKRWDKAAEGDALPASA